MGRGWLQKGKGILGVYLGVLGFQVKCSFRGYMHSLLPGVVCPHKAIILLETTIGMEVTVGD